jgi:hypothetical protein
LKTLMPIEYKNFLKHLKLRHPYTEE